MTHQATSTVWTTVTPHTPMILIDTFEVDARCTRTADILAVIHNELPTVMKALLTDRANTLIGVGGVEVGVVDSCNVVASGIRVAQIAYGV